MDGVTDRVDRPCPRRRPFWNHVHGSRRVRVLAIALGVLAACGGGSGGSDPPDNGGGVSPNTCVAPAEPALGEHLRLERIFPEVTLSLPVAMVEEPESDARWYVVEQKGRILSIDRGTADVDVALDWRDRVIDREATHNYEAGLLGLAFHPDYQQNGRVFVYATLEPEPGEVCALVVLEELQRTAPGRFDPEPVRRILEARSNCRIREDGTPITIHHGGTLHFDPSDGSLVIGIGDLNRRPSAGDPGQVEGTLLRLDVDTATEGVPVQTLPGVNVPAETIAHGFRNPWKWSFDRLTGDLWVGDVGERRWEEINQIAPGQITPGGHYGWPIVEGESCVTEPCTVEDFVAPSIMYPHGDGCAVTGGYVYRGTLHEELRGVYIYADWCSGQIWGRFPDGSVGLLAFAEFQVSSFAEDAQGELYVIDHVGALYRLASFQRADRDDFPTRLSETGCTLATDPTQPIPELVPYELNILFWSDTADKRRWMSLPNGAEASIGDDGDWTFPIGTVLMKEFRLGDQRVETRLFMHHADGGWQGYSYAWNPEQTEAVLVPPFGDRRLIESAGQDWIYPGRQQCLRCHTGAAGRALGPEIAQLDRIIEEQPDVAGMDQLSWLVARGVVSGDRVADFAETPPFFDWRRTPMTFVDTEAAARGYLHTNCSFCHRPGGPTAMVVDFRAARALNEMGVCNVISDRGELGIDDLLRLAPGEPERSAIWHRMLDRGEYRMPPLASLIADDTALDRVGSWIASLEGCE